MRSGCVQGTVASLFALGLLAYTDGVTQPPSATACPSCETGADTGPPDSDAFPGEASVSVVCDVEEVPLTPAAERAFDLERLRDFLAEPATVEGHFGERDASAAETERSATAIELTFEIGEFTHYAGMTESSDDCGEVRAPAHVEVRIGNGLLLFQADGLLLKTDRHVSAWFYASTDLTTVGSYEPELDTTRAHAGKVEISLYAFPGQLRGDINLVAIYFRDETQRERYLQGRRWAYVDRQTLFQLGFPHDECEDHELPFAHDEAIEVLNGQSADELRARAANLVAETLVFDGVWRNDSETRVAVEIGEPVEGTVCVASSETSGDLAMKQSSDWLVRVPVAGRLHSADARIDMPLENFILGLDDKNAISRATLRGIVSTADLKEDQRQRLGADVDQVDARVSYGLDSQPAEVDGIVYLQQEAQSRQYSWTDCIAFPPGGAWDIGECRYSR